MVDAATTPSIIERLGLPAIINAEGRFTMLGGSLMSPEVLAAMSSAATAHVDIFELQRRAGDHLAKLTGNESAHVCTGAAAGLVLCTLAARVGADLVQIARLPESPGRPDQVIAHRCHRVPYSPAVRLAGAELIEFGDAIRTEPWEMEAAINERTAAVLYVERLDLARAALSLEETVAIADRHGLPVIVDAAAQLPPMENLWRLTVDAGAAAAVFSGGKDLCGPQSSGLIVGRREFLSGVAANAAPHQRFARAMKVGKEEIAGLVAAVERYLELDHGERARALEAVIERWRRQLEPLAGVTVTRSEWNQAGQPIPRLMVGVGARRAGPIRSALRSADRPIAVGMHDHATLYLTPECLTLDADIDEVAHRLTTEMSRF